MWQDKINKVWCGDCLELMKEMPDKCVDLVLTDPPYNISQKSGGLRELDFGEWDKDKNNEIVFNAIKEINRICKGTIIIFCGNQQFSYIYNFLEAQNLITKCLVWLKPNPSVINCEYSYVTGQELIVYAKNRNTLFNPDYKLSYFKFPFPNKRLHPTQKPIELFAELIKDCSEKNSLVFDPFMGSWTTARACIDLGRNFIGAELSLEYCKTGENRLRQQILL
jgi:site-specific DNA-methyltransferase (adenine-specific)